MLTWGWMLEQLYMGVHRWPDGEAVAAAVCLRRPVSSAPFAAADDDVGARCSTCCPATCAAVLFWLWPQVSELIERFAEGSAEREAPLHALKKALQLVAADCHASYAR